MTVNKDLAARVLTRETVLEDVTRIVAEQVGTRRERIREEHLLEEDLGCDSLTRVEITMEVEDHFDISISDEQADQVRRVGDIVDGVLTLLAGDEA